MELTQNYYRIRAKAIRRAKIRALNEPPRLTLGEEIFNAASHGAGALLAAAATALLLVRSDTAAKIMASCFYGISMMDADERDLPCHAGRFPCQAHPAAL